MVNVKRAEKYCCEDISRIENYDKAIADKTQIWEIHHRLEIQGQFRNSRELLKRCGIYYKVPASQLIFLTHAEHARLHNKSKSLSEETRRKLSKVNKGENNPLFGKHRSEETRKKISDARKRYWTEMKNGEAAE